MFWRHKEAPRYVAFTAGKGNAPNLKDGKARLVIEAVSSDLRGRTDAAGYDVEVSTRPPRVVADGYQHYINQGGMELATLTPSGYVTDSGVKVGKYSFRSFPLPGRAGERFAMFAYPWDLGPDVAPFVYATNPTGTVARGTFCYKVFPRKFRVRDFELTDPVMDKLVNQIDPSGSGTLLERFLKINRDLRRQNNQTLADLRLKTEEKVLWNGPFIRLGKEESMFADVRNYIYKGQKVDQQVHLGLRPFQRSARSRAGGQRRARGVRRGPGHLRQLHRGGPRLRAAIDLRAPERDLGQARRYGEKGPDHGTQRRNGARAGRPSALQHADRRRPDQPGGVVGRPLDPRPHHEQAEPGRGSPGRHRRTLIWWW